MEDGRAHLRAESEGRRRARAFPLEPPRLPLQGKLEQRALVPADGRRRAREGRGGEGRRGAARGARCPRRVPIVQEELIGGAGGDGRSPFRRLTERHLLELVGHFRAEVDADGGGEERVARDRVRCHDVEADAAEILDVGVREGGEDPGVRRL